ncbi:MULTISPECIES: 16S rRNA (cytidine(1402)-2'-O)-methyltransferase [Clostridium]|uniref:Ribosomal RNA small subunit methyltransferase I n=3 Tax=Clostridium TaxID=1485 RepID=D8GKQ5_CLOLD|nr:MULTISPECIES: 16S rRNA (cytidine(1402)-2'-O)-methyltransferase [Clostridium]ADK13238.1 corrin/porphyrin methyltransferase [Clostridium ljungdahlii DSM 13528]AGY76465.1 16S rRNA (cytidine(1402)-2'-O)-methyltransferase [Clostridium autoethanogenum DSM 10061]ALU36627.1 Ribosomal RNA small subunit methyltransferase I [Clostridium autoethanogenum DSM 10061]OAA83703.1 Ribosomal RNA small subunit methyltransferase I [Clostridium ljungdahlii DSM 13528]OAA85740.1 Ribosomal RNA small subunit methyltr
MGKLFLVATPIGNLSDITLRALDTLKNVDLIAAEDTRQSLKLLNHFNIKKPLISCHKYNENEKSKLLIQKLKDGKDIALVSDAGTPGISDPGSIMVKSCIEQGIEFEVLPGATAVTTALVYSGLDTSRFTFIGFLPRENKDRRSILEGVKNRTETLIFYEAPHRLTSTLEVLATVLGNRHIGICRELTKVHEEILRFTLEEAMNYYESNNAKGEFVLVVEGKDEKELLREESEKWINLSIEKHIKMYMEDGLDKKEAIKKVAKDRKLSKSEVYKYSLNL